MIRVVLSGLLLTSIAVAFICNIAFHNGGLPFFDELGFLAGSTALCTSLLLWVANTLADIRLQWRFRRDYG